MIDLHCHILHGIDDGSNSLEESIKMARSAYEIGYRKICCTSHYGFGKYENKNYKKKISELSETLKSEGIPIEIYSGNELYLDLEGMRALVNGEVNTLGNSRYVLLEGVPGMTSDSLIGAIEKVIQSGYKPVLAHVERCFFLKMSDVEKLEEMGVVLQVNLSSFSDALKKRTTALLEKRLIHIVASDSHGTGRRSYEDADAGLKELKKIVGKDRMELLTRINPKRILEDCQIEGGGNEEKQNINSSFFSRFFGKFFRN
ncbi:CpsB/CapC family capsule biosynthesis tyrosine phosphatase [uncultured Ilyobacter sp.]|uniref:tyrosine-protein phosphatase n=1 Tax=uncultured Ilyobacter sp. TaxID=544433 RepID=UPI0029C75DAE|nr:CpsB/CapC family capsule biosynthesis tyrosine phosphatase [uncultured Ilyobacter sp.]